MHCACLHVPPRWTYCASFSDALRFLAFCLSFFGWTHSCGFGETLRVLAYTFHVNILRLLILLLYLGLCRMPSRYHVDMLRSLLSCRRHPTAQIAAGFFVSKQKVHFLCPFYPSPMLRGALDVGMSLFLLHIHSLETPLPSQCCRISSYHQGVPLIAHKWHLYKVL